NIRTAGAIVIDPIVIPRLTQLMQSNRPSNDLDSETVSFRRNPNSPFKTRDDLRKSPDYDKIFNRFTGFAPGTPGALAFPEGVRTPERIAAARARNAGGGGGGGAAP